MNDQIQQHSRNETVYELKYDLQSSDLAAYEGNWWANHRLVSTSVYPLAIIFAVAIGLLVPFLFFLVVRLFGGEWAWQLNLIYVYGVAAALLIIVWRLPGLKKTVLSRLANSWTSHSFDEQSLGARQLTATQDQIEVSGPNGTTRRTWCAVTRIATTDNHAFIYADVTFIVPRRPFQSEEEFEEFVKSIKSWRAQSESAKKLSITSVNVEKRKLGETNQDRIGF